LVSQFLLVSSAVIETNSACPISVSFVPAPTAQNEWIAISLQEEIANEKNTDNENGLQ